MSKSLSNHQCFTYALPVVTTAWLVTPIGVVQGIYAKYYGLPLTTIATVLFLVRFFDAVTDPLIGYYADRYYKSNGTYKPFILVGGLLFIISSYFLYVPPKQVGAFYLTIWFALFYLAWTLFEMPHLTWASKLAQSSEAKAKIYSFRNIANYSGWLLFYSVPLLPVFESRAITPDTLHVSVLAAGLLMVPLLLISLKTKHRMEYKQAGNYKNHPKDTGHNLHRHKKPIIKFLQSLLANRPLIIFLAAYTLIYLGMGMWYSLIFLYVDVYLGLGEQYAEMFLLAFVIGIAATPLWYRLMVWLGKKTTWILSTLLLIISFIFTIWLSAEVTTFTKLVALKAIQTMGFTCLNVVGPAMLSEIIDYSNWKQKSDKNAIYFAIYTFIIKAVFAISTAIGLGLVGWFGFDAAANGQTLQAIFGMTLAIGWVPTSLAIIALVFITLLPINERRHKVIRDRLNAISARRTSEL